MSTPTLPELHGWDGPWAGLRVLVTGFGVTGFSAADTLAELGCQVVVVDGTQTQQKNDDAATLTTVWGDRLDFRWGQQSTTTLAHFEGDQLPDLIVTSPGWRPDSPIMHAAAEASIPVWSEVQLARRLGARPGARQPDWLMLTGTNGKTTTVTLLEAMLIADGRRAVACGNIGMPVLDAIRDPEGFEALAVELSSFQLHYTEAPGEHEAGPLAAAVLNIAEDHVDWHGSLESYLADKARIYQATQVACVYNAEDPATEQMVAAADVVEGARAIGFTTSTPDISMLGLVHTEEGDDVVVDRAYLDNRAHQALELGARSDLGQLAPRHLVANALAAAALARAAGVAPEAVQQALRSYQPAEHRIQPVAQAEDVLWINDTKATNPHAAAASLSSFSGVVWIAGGLSKGVDYSELVQQVAPKLQHVVLIGTDSTQLRSSLERHAPQVPVTEVSGGDDGVAAMRSAVEAADTHAQPGQAVVLAPAAASMDQFASYIARGEAFIEAVADLMRRKGFNEL
ncbi:UDP-N-acetylmuramoyl-L-alanine--D-glutamate ligase [Nesterenkonia ebinurensis]|uniref:UDP-N-acetylmuramoyl-L-alanine--D-glutamate ligase n=1 Tax=Nesterenkonia ebinurensis TaxID=2608252 RepID=UPI00168B6D65|nr:UDP-N-acetylmuramoyl-L-alanine--D-glutamate ligase [Nesterenkonia ebinurensis]